MKLLVCIKRVPDTATKLSVDPNGKSIATAGVDYVISPYDEYAIEEAIRKKEANEGSEVTVLSVGDNCSKELRTALAMGADKAVNLKADIAGADSLAIAKAIAAHIQSEAYDLIFFGKSSADSANYMVGGAVAALLDLPCINMISSLDLADGKAACKREIEGGIEIVESPLPLVVCTDKGINEPRYTSLKGVMAAKKKPLDEIAVTLDAPGYVVESLAQPPARQAGEIVGEGPDAVAELVRRLHEEAKVI